MKRTNRLTAVVAVILILVLALSVIPLAAFAKGNGKKGFTKPTIIEVPEKYVSSRDTTITKTLQNKGSVGSYDFEQYSSSYYYSKMNVTQQYLYDEMKDEAERIMHGNFSTSKYGVSYYTNFLSTELSRDEIIDVFVMFAYANPQYYFIKPTLIYSSNNVALTVYERFSTPKDIKHGNDLIQSKLEEYKREIDQVINSNPTGVQIETAIHDTLCDKLDYDISFDTSYDDDFRYTQTIYGALVNNITVCAGYSKLFSALANSYGLECIALTSDYHAWNKIRLDNDWFNVDVTWDDNDNYTSTSYFNITDSELSKSDKNNYHTPDSVTSISYPKSEISYNKNNYKQYVEKEPSYTLKKTDKGLELSFDGDNIYYSNVLSVKPYNDAIIFNKKGTYYISAFSDTPTTLKSKEVYIKISVTKNYTTDSDTSNTDECKQSKLSSVKIKSSSGKKALYVKWKSVKSADGYIVRYSTGSNMLDSTMVRTKKTFIKRTKLKSNKYYYVQVRAYKYEDGEEIYSDWSKRVKIKVKL